MNSIKKDGKNYILWSDVNEDFNLAKSIMYGIFGEENIDGDHSIEMDFHFILTDEQLLEFNNVIK